MIARREVVLGSAAAAAAGIAFPALAVKSGTSVPALTAEVSAARTRAIEQFIANFNSGDRNGPLGDRVRLSTHRIGAKTSLTLQQHHHFEAVSFAQVVVSFTGKHTPSTNFFNNIIQYLVFTFGSGAEIMSVGMI